MTGRLDAMDLRQLRYFSTIAADGGFSKAAARLGIAQSALSRHMKGLEKELGVTLLERHARGVTLTESGALLMERANQILEQVEDARAEVMAQARLPTGEAVIGTTSTTSRILYGPLAERFARDYPNVRLSFVEGIPYLLLEGLDTGRIHIAVMVDPEPQASLILEELVTEQVYLIATPEGNRHPDGPCRVADLAGVPLVLLPRPAGSRVKLDRAAAEARITLRVTHEVANIDVVKDFVDRSLGLGLLPHSSVMADVEAGRYRAFPVEGMTLTRTLVRRADRTPSPAVAELARMIHAEIERMRDAGTFGVAPNP